MSTAAVRASAGPASSEVARRAIEQALRAPSTRNSQPWKWRVGDGTVELHADDTRQVAALDPDRRDLVLSCGAALHHLRVALAGSGCATRTLRLPDPGNPAHLATVLVVGHAPDPDEASLAAVIEHRRTDRRRFGPRPVRSAHLDTLRAHAAACGAALLPVTGETVRARLHAALTEAASRPRHAIGFSDELVVWAPDPPEGDAAADLPPAPRRISRTADGSCLLMITTAADGVIDRLRAGEAASAVLLAATRLGLASTLLRQPEAHHPPGDHPPRTCGQPQLMLRVGWPPDGAAALPATPRRPLSSVLLPA